MSIEQHTPGPWFVDEDELNVCAPDPEEPDVPWVVAGVRVGCGYPESQDGANARLIAAAPELLEALETVLQVKRTDDRSIVFAPHAVAKARAAIAKARGES